MDRQEELQRTIDAQYSLFKNSVKTFVRTRLLSVFDSLSHHMSYTLHFLNNSNRTNSWMSADINVYSSRFFFVRKKLFTIFLSLHYDTNFSLEDDFSVGVSGEIRRTNIFTFLKEASLNEIHVGYTSEGKQFFSSGLQESVFSFCDSLRREIQGKFKVRISINIEP